MRRRSNVGRDAEWRQRLERFAGWAGTVAEFCRRERVAQPTFYRWRKRLRLATNSESRERINGQSEASPTDAADRGRARFVELSVEPLTAVEIELPNGALVRVPAEREAMLRVAIRAAGEVVSCSS